MYDKNFCKQFVDFCSNSQSCQCDIVYDSNESTYYEAKIYYAGHYICHITTSQIMMFEDFFNKERSSWEYVSRSFSKLTERVNLAKAKLLITNIIERLNSDIAYAEEQRLLRLINEL